MRSIDQRLMGFVAQFGRVPREARQLEDYEARNHDSPLIQRLLGQGVGGQYVLVYQRGEMWWTFCFDRWDRSDDLVQERWDVEAYSFDGSSWRQMFLYDVHSGEWQPSSAGTSPTR